MCRVDQYCKLGLRNVGIVRWHPGRAGLNTLDATRSSSRDLWIGFTKCLQEYRFRFFWGCLRSMEVGEGICLDIFGPWTIGNGELEMGEEEGPRLGFRLLASQGYSKCPMVQPV